MQSSKIEKQKVYKLYININNKMENKCLRCGYVWKSKKQDVTGNKPVCCPCCKRYDWEKVTEENKGKLNIISNQEEKEEEIQEEQK